MTKSDILKNTLIKALEKSLGIVTSACKNAGCSRETFYKYCKDDADFKKRVKDIENIALDFAESKLHKQIAAGNSTSTIFFLKTKGKKRGYIEKNEIDVTTKSDLSIYTDEEIAKKLKEIANNN